MDNEWLKPQKKLKKNVITLEEKIAILNRLKNGERPSFVAKTLDLNESTIRTIKLNEKKIRDSVICGLNINAKSVTRVRNILLEKMEKSLMIWIEDCYQKKIAVGSSDIKKKALKVYAHLKKLDQDSAEKNANGFRASNGWFEKFKKRWHLYNCKIHEESQSTDVETVYPPELLEIINDNGFNAEQLFKNDEIGCNRKKKPIRTFFTKNEDIVQLIKKETDIESNKTDNSDIVEDAAAEPVKEIDYNKLTEGLNMAENLANFFKENDPLTQRSSKFARQLNICLVSYRELHEKLKDSDKQCVTS